MKIAIGSDHAGYKMKLVLKEQIEKMGHTVCDVGCNDESSCDYPDYAAALAKEILSGNCERGILVCGTGIGMSMVANQFPGIRAAACSDYFSARMTRAHNDANVLCLGARVIGEGTAMDLTEIFLTTPFDTTGNHSRRLGKLREIENTLCAGK